MTIQEQITEQRTKAAEYKATWLANKEKIDRKSRQVARNAAFQLERCTDKIAMLDAMSRSSQFTQEEKGVMDAGRTFSEARQAIGGIWTVGNIQFPQAISAEHAIKLYSTTFPYNNEPVYLAE